jgi:hemolysin activation/secretion protein
MNLCFSRTAVILMLICIPLCNTNAQTSIEQGLDQERLLKQQQTIMERQIKEQEIQKKIEKSKVETLFEAPKESEDEEFVQGKCFELKEIVFKNDTLLSKGFKKKLTNEFIGKCINQELLQSIVRNVTNYYVRKGYITTRAFINPQDINTGKLEVLIIEGKLERIEFDGEGSSAMGGAKQELSQLEVEAGGESTISNNKQGGTPVSLNNKQDTSSSPTLFHKTQTLSAFGNIEGKNLNIRNIEQGVEQLNRLPSNNATMKIVPSTQTGYSNIMVSKNKQSRTTRVRVGANNAGQEQTGMYNGRIMIEQDNLLKVNDSTIAVFSHDLNRSKNPDGSNQKGNKNIYTNINIPFGMWNASSSFVSSSYLSTIPVLNALNTRVYKVFQL